MHTNVAAVISNYLALALAHSSSRKRCFAGWQMAISLEIFGEESTLVSTMRRVHRTYSHILSVQSTLYSQTSNDGDDADGDGIVV